MTMKFCIFICFCTDRLSKRGKCTYCWIQIISSVHWNCFCVYKGGPNRGQQQPLPSIGPWIHHHPSIFKETVWVEGRRKLESCKHLLYFIRSGSHEYLLHFIPGNTTAATLTWLLEPTAPSTLPPPNEHILHRLSVPSDLARSCHLCGHPPPPPIVIKLAVDPTAPPPYHTTVKPPKEYVEGPVTKNLI